MTNVSTIIVFAAVIAIVPAARINFELVLQFAALGAFSGWIFCWMRRPN